MSVLRRLSIAIAVAAVGLVALTVTPASARPITGRTTIGCGQEVTTSIVVANDLTCTSGPILRVTGTGVTIDLNGHRITGYGIASFCKLQANTDCSLEIPSGSTVENGRLSNLSLGIEGGSATSVDVRSGSIVVLRDGARLLDSKVTDSRIHLVQRDATVSRNKLLRSNIRVDDTDYGVGVSITDNTLVDSPLTDPSIPFSDPRFLPTVFGAISSANYLVFHDDIKGEISRNRIRGSAGDAIALRTSQVAYGAFLISDNDLRNNAGNGISVLGDEPSFPLPFRGGPITLTGNTALRNGGHGIVVDTPSAEVVDGGENQARRNSEDPQCVGVDCTWAT